MGNGDDRDEKPQATGYRLQASGSREGAGNEYVYEYVNEYGKVYVQPGTRN
jgi:hypothetical protein